ncbi:MAG: hypothetical protein K8H86_00140 [Ignavibacteriaceae bacterium]|nr:hypothetical protein [Ignavibacteriaceae bacterium]
MSSIFVSSLFNSYSKYIEEKLENKRFTHSDILPLITKAAASGNLLVNSTGHSFENREIFSLKFGNGKTKILLWSQMHGDEPTATMALFDIFNFLNADDEFNNYREMIKEKLTLIFVPMLNPDGAERILRCNAAGIDLNRDAARLQSPESKILMELTDTILPQFAFNLHDQDYRWSVGDSNKLASISFLAPAYDVQKSVSPARADAMKLIAKLKQDFEIYLSGQIARYPDDFESRSFGDTISGKGVSTILIECGREVGNINKSYLRKINFMLLLSSFKEIAEKKYLEQNSLDNYFSIPTNGKFLFDLILRKVNFITNGRKYYSDIAINREEVYADNSRVPFFFGKIEDMGDLSPFNGLEEFDASELYFEAPKVAQKLCNNIADLNSEYLSGLLRDGFQFVKYVGDINQKSFTNLPINLISKNSTYLPAAFPASAANFNLLRNGSPFKQVVNGWLINPGETSLIKNGLIF